MITAVDSSALIAVYLGELNSDRWMDLLVQSRKGGALVICDIVAAELFAAVQERHVFDQVMQDLGLLVTQLSVDAACEAGRIFGRYRKQGGPRQSLIPDFLIGAFAMVDCDQLISADRGYLRTYFSGLKVLMAD